MLQKPGSEVALRQLLREGGQEKLLLTTPNTTVCEHQQPRKTPANLNNIICLAAAGELVLGSVPAPTIKAVLVM